MILIVTYDLKGPAGSYEEFFEVLKAYDSWSHYLRSTWLISTDKTPAEVFEELRSFIREGDRLLIARLSKERQGFLPRKAWDWIKRYEE
jgi:hypothetical protein